MRKITKFGLKFVKLFWKTQKRIRVISNAGHKIGLLVVTNLFSVKINMDRPDFRQWEPSYGELSGFLSKISQNLGFREV